MSLIFLPSPLSSRLPNCPHCGKELPVNDVSTAKIVAAGALGFYVVLTVSVWGVEQGGGFGEARTLLEFVADQWRYVWYLLRNLW